MRRKNRINFVLLTLISLLILMIVASPVDAYSTWGHWRPSHVGLKYDHLSSDWRNVVYNSRMTWNNVGAGMYITYDSSSPYRVTVDLYGDIGWYGATYLPSSGGWISDAQVRINASYCIPRDPYLGEMDGQSVATHELGHFDGLAGSAEYQATMWDGLWNDYFGQTFRRTLESDDINGIFALYPPVYRLYNGANHFYTQSASERDTLISWGWSYEGVRFYAYGGVVGGNVPFYRLYNGADHLYTISAAERDMLISWGWSYEGIATYVLEGAADDTRTLYRLYNGRDHFYTIDPSEKTTLQLSDTGWRDQLHTSDIDNYVRPR